MYQHIICSMADVSLQHIGWVAERAAARVADGRRVQQCRLW